MFELSTRYALYALHPHAAYTCVHNAKCCFHEQPNTPVHKWLSVKDFMNLISMLVCRQWPHTKSLQWAQT